jgi:chitinase
VKAHGFPVAIASLFATVGASGFVLADDLRPSTHIAAYYQTWSVEIGSTSPLDETLVNLPAGLTEILLAFARPDIVYAGNLDLSNTGLEVPYPGSVLKASLTALKARLPGVKILISIGGEAYANWDKFDQEAIKRFVRDFELDGVDLDFEPAAPKCQNLTGRVSCATDSTLLEVVKSARGALPRPYVLWLTATNTGAYGEGRWRTRLPAGSPSYGAFVPLLRDRHSSAMLDTINIMAYDAGPSFRPLEAYAAYRSYFPGSILIGVTSPPEAWGGHEYSIAEAVGTIKAAMEQGAEGAVVFAIGKEPPGHPSPATPAVGDLMTALIQTVRSGHKAPRRLRDQRGGRKRRCGRRGRSRLSRCNNPDRAGRAAAQTPRAD